MTQTLPIAGRTLTFGEITVKAARDAKLASLATSNPSAFTDAIVVESLRAGGHVDAQEVFDGLSFFIDMNAVQKAAFAANGLKTEIDKPGETQPAGPAAV